MSICRYIIRGTLVLLLCCVASLLIPSRPVLAQQPPLDPNTAGTRYVIAFPDTITNANDPRFPPTAPDTVAIILYSAVDNSVSITGKAFSQVVNLEAGKFKTVFLDSSRAQADRALVSEFGVASDNTFRVEAKEPIILYCYMMTKFGCEGWTPTPVDLWGKEYHAAAIPGEVAVDMARGPGGNYIRTNKMASGEILVIAAYDQTQISIYPNGRVSHEEKTSVILNAGQAYQMQSFVDTIFNHAGYPQVDFGGAQIIANKPIGVVSGNTRAQAVPEQTTVTGNAIKNMMFEWLPSVEQYGREFVYLPTWDAVRILNVQGEKLGEKRIAEFVRVFSATNGTLASLAKVPSGTDTVTVDASHSGAFKILFPQPHLIRTSLPAEVMMNSSGVVKFNGTATGSTGTENFSAWGAFMVELTPREQWSTFAPYYIQSYPLDVHHYINVVADTNSIDEIFDETGAPFDFNRGPIPGTDLVWGSIEITPNSNAANVNHFLEARDGHKFFAYIYGLRQGNEIFRPEIRGTKPAEYVENVGLSYAYPLAPGRKIFRQSDDLKIDTVSDHCSMNVKVHANNPNPVGLLSIKLDGASENVKIVYLNPAGVQDVAGLSTAEVNIVPIDPLRDAHATVMITDRTAKVWTLPFAYTGARIDFSAVNQVDFGEVADHGTKDSIITITNPLNHSVEVKDVYLRFGNASFTIISTQPSAPTVLPPGGMIVVTVRSAPAVAVTPYRDTLKVRLNCAEIGIPVRIGPAPPCISAVDLDFGTVDVNTPLTRMIQVCNLGHGIVTFSSTESGSTVTIPSNEFTIPKTVLDSLKQVKITANQCFSIPVTFKAKAEGTYEAVARFWANTRDCRDTCVVHAVVKKGTPVVGVDESAVAGYAMREILPNPTTGGAVIDFTLGSGGHVDLGVFNAQGDRVATLADGMMTGGDHHVSWNAGELP
ncbi:MAG: IgGFc-binding protein, partial [Chlorobi bacterium]|nr:IgGFc-binding protein [Chlorobiota bacterium]